MGASCPNHHLANGEVVEIIGGRIPAATAIERGSWRHPGAREGPRLVQAAGHGRELREGREMFERELSRLGAEHSLTSDLIGEFNLGADALHSRSVPAS
jgi:hypothetical protein